MMSTNTGDGYPGATWVDTHSGNFSTGRTAGVTGGLTHIVLHTCEGSASSCLNSLTRDRTGEAKHSAHYLVTKDGTIFQMVLEADTAWHAGARNSAYTGFAVGELVNGVPVQRPMPNYNPNSIGIEIEGYADNPATWSPALVESLGQLLRYLTQEHGIPLVYRDQNTMSRGNETALAVGARASGIVSHGTLDPARRYDPGPWFPWEEVKVAALGKPRAQSSLAAIPAPVLMLSLLAGFAWWRAQQ